MPGSDAVSRRVATDGLLVAELGAQQAEGARLDAAIAANLEKLGFRTGDRNDLS